MLTNLFRETELVGTTDLPPLSVKDNSSDIQSAELHFVLYLILFIQNKGQHNYAQRDQDRIIPELMSTLYMADKIPCFHYQYINSNVNTLRDFAKEWYFVMP